MSDGPGPGYLLWLEHVITHRFNPRADCISCFPPIDTPAVLLRGLIGLPADPFQRGIQYLPTTPTPAEPAPPLEAYARVWLENWFTQPRDVYTADEMIEAWSAGYERAWLDVDPDGDD